MYKFVHEHSARTFAYQQGQSGWDTIVTSCDSFWWVEVLQIMYTELNKKDFEVIFDVLNVYDPNDIQSVYPAMGSEEFVDDVKDAWKKVFKVVKLNQQCETSSSVFHQAKPDGFYSKTNGNESNSNGKQIIVYTNRIDVRNLYVFMYLW